MIEIIPLLSKIVIFTGLYFTIFWVLTVLNDIEIKSKNKLKNWPSLTIIVPAYNEEETLEKTLNSCLKSKYKGKLEIMIINDASKDNTINIAKKYEKKYHNIIKVLDLKKNRGKAGAVNEGLKIINTEFVAMIDADCTINTDTVKNAIELFYNNDETTQQVGAVMCQMRPSNENKNILERIQLIEYMMVGLIRYLSASQRLLHMTNGGSFYRTKVVKELGGFDHNNLTEDFEMGVKVRKANYLILYSKESKIYTNTPNKFKIFLKQRIRWSRGFIQTHKKHKNIFFNIKYGLFGIYQFPMNIIGPIIYFLAIFTISYNVYKKLYEFIFKLIYTPDLIGWFQFDSLKDIILTIDPKVDMIILSSFLLMMILFYGIIKFYDYNFFKKSPIKKIISFILYIMVYNYIYIYVWIISIIREYKKAKYDWGTK